MISSGRVRMVGVVVLAWCVAATVPAQADAPSLADRVIEHKLANGMTVLLVERHQAPLSAST